MKKKEYKPASKLTRVLLDLDRPLTIKQKKEVKAAVAGRLLQRSIDNFDGSSRSRTPTQDELRRRNVHKETLSAFSDNVRTVGTKKVKEKKKKK